VRRRAAVLAFALLSIGACTSPYLPYETEVSESTGGPILWIEPVEDARVFARAGASGPNMSVDGNPADAALTRRVVGRRVSTIGESTGTNVVLPPGQTVAGEVERALVSALREAGWDARSAAVGGGVAPDDAPRIAPRLERLWLWRRRSSPDATIAYQARLTMWESTGLPAGPREYEINQSVTAGAADPTLWRRALRRALEKLSASVAEGLGPPQQPSFDRLGV